MIDSIHILQRICPI